MNEGLQSAAGGAGVPADLGGLQFSCRSARGHAGSRGLGDFADAFSLPSGRWGIVVGEARVGAACQNGTADGGVALARAVLRATAQVEFRPAMVLSSANRALLAAPARDRRPVAVTYVTLRPGRAGAWASICTVGGQLAYVRRRDGQVAAHGRSGPPLGAEPDVQPCLARLLLRPGDSLVLVTDSVAGALGSEDDAVGERGAAAAGAGRLRAILSDLGGASAARTADTILRAVRDAAGGQPAKETVAVAVKVPGRRRGSGVHSAGWPGTRRYSHVALAAHAPVAEPADRG